MYTNTVFSGAFYASTDISKRLNLTHQDIRKHALLINKYAILREAPHRTAF
jgi:hypothetical protein